MKHIATLLLTLSVGIVCGQPTFKSTVLTSEALSRVVTPDSQWVNTPKFSEDLVPLIYLINEQNGRKLGYEKVTSLTVVINSLMRREPLEFIDYTSIREILAGTEDLFDLAEQLAAHNGYNAEVLFQPDVPRIGTGVGSAQDVLLFDAVLKAKEENWSSSTQRLIQAFRISRLDPDFPMPSGPYYYTGLMILHYIQEIARICPERSCLQSLLDAVSKSPPPIYPKDGADAAWLQSVLMLRRYSRAGYPVQFPTASIMWYLAESAVVANSYDSWSKGPAGTAASNPMREMFYLVIPTCPFAQFPEQFRGARGYRAPEDLQQVRNCRVEFELAKLRLATRIMQVTESRTPTQPAELVPSYLSEVPKHPNYPRQDWVWDTDENTWVSSDPDSSK